MTPTRRDFVKGVGIALASYVLARCTPPTMTPATRGYPTPVAPAGTPGPTGAQGARERLRHAWLQFGWLATETRGSQNQADMGEAARQQLVAEHQQALQELVAAGELSQAVAGYAQEAYAAAAYHIWRSNAPITCYEPMLVDYTPGTAGQLVQQADLLARMAEQGDLDPNTVAQVQRTIERDMAFLALSYDEVQQLYQQLIDTAGGSYAFPSFEELALETPSEAAEAARFLVELLLEE